MPANYELWSFLCTIQGSSKSSNIAITIRLMEQVPYFKVYKSCTTESISRQSGKNEDLYYFYT